MDTFKAELEEQQKRFEQAYELGRDHGRKEMRDFLLGKLPHHLLRAVEAFAEEHK